MNTTTSSVGTQTEEPIEVENENSSTTSLERHMTDIRKVLQQHKSYAIEQRSYSIASVKISENHINLEMSSTTS